MSSKIRSSENRNRDDKKLSLLRNKVLGLKCNLNDSQKDIKMTQLFLSQLKETYPNIVLNGDQERRNPGHLHLTFPDIRWDQWLLRISEHCISMTSACNSDTGLGSHVLHLIGFKDTEIRSGL